MNFELHKNMAGRPAHFILLLSVLLMPTSGQSQDVVNQWNIEPIFYLAAVSKHQKINGTSTHYEVIAIMAELKFSSGTRPWNTSLFVDYSFSKNRRFRDSVNVGGQFKYTVGKWDLTNYLFVNRSYGNSDTWLYATRLRYQLLENHKFGIELSDSLHRPKSPIAALGYYGSLSESLSLNMIAGTGIGAGSGLSAQFELSWSTR